MSLKKKLIIAGVIITVICAIILVLYIKQRLDYKNDYLFMPENFKESEVFFPEYEKVTKPIQLEISNDGFRDNWIIIDDLDQVKFVIEELQKSSYVTRSRGEFEDLNLSYPSSMENTWDVVIRTVDDEEGNGSIIFMFEFAEDYEYIYAGTPYYFYTISDDLRNYVMQTLE